MVTEGSVSVENWLSRLAPATARMNRHELGYFMKWLGSNGVLFSDYTPDQLVDYQKKATNGQQYDILDIVRARFAVSLLSVMSYLGVFRGFKK